MRKREPRDVLGADGQVLRGERDVVGGGLTEVSQDVPRRAHERGVLDRGERDGVAALEQLVQTLERGFRPLHGGEEFRRADAAVLVGVNEVERLWIELDAARGHGKGDPEFLVELVEAGEVRARAQRDRVHAAGCE